MSDTMSTLLQKMQADATTDAKFTDNQVKSIVEVLIPRMITAMPGMPPGMTCVITDRDDTGWTVRIERPRS